MENNIEAKIQAYEQAKVQYETKLKELETKLAVLENEKQQLVQQMQELFGTTDILVAEQQLNQMIVEIEALEKELEGAKNA